MEGQEVSSSIFYFVKPNGILLSRKVEPLNHMNSFSSTFYQSSSKGSKQLT